MINNKYTKLGMTMGLFVCLAISMMVMASAEYLPQQQNTAFTLTITSNNATACNLSSIQYPDGTQTLFNSALTKSGQTFYKTIASGNYSQLGTTCHYIGCTDGITQETGSVCREVTYTGDLINGSKMGVYGIALVFLIIMALGLGLFAHRMNGEDSRSDDGSILQINMLKHVKPILWIGVWILAMVIMFIVSNMGIAFLPNAMIGDLFFKFYQILFWLTIVGVPVYFIYLIVKAVESKELQRMIERGVDIKSM